jgi:hypothetical protein
MAEKVVNYTEAQTVELKAAYVAAVDAGMDYDERKRTVIDVFAEKFGKSAKSIVAKLTREGIYKPAEYVSKNGEKPVKKDAHADAIGKVLNLTEPETESLTKANKTALVKIFSALANSIPREVESPDDEAAKPALVAVLARVAGLTDDEARSLSRVSRSTLAKVAAFAEDEVSE